MRLNPKKLNNDAAGPRGSRSREVIVSGDDCTNLKLVQVGQVWSPRPDGDAEGPVGNQGVLGVRRVLLLSDWSAVSNVICLIPAEATTN